MFFAFFMHNLCISNNAIQKHRLTFMLKIIINIDIQAKDIDT